ncbi:hypothetical protein [Massilia sp. TWR1-2-2]|uniref:hypothetical protein n=1 Tax=Massilia sp. TWR1-2-2 TaxID=2804584 RepID=UPI003CEE5632
METSSLVSAIPANDAATPAVAPLRATGRPDHLTAQRVEVAIILQAMLGTPSAAEYLATNAVDPAVVSRVLYQPQLRRGRHDAHGVRC